MGLKRDVSLMTALRYKGQGPYLTYILHRIGGLGMAIFITLHIMASFMEGRGWKIGDVINDVYKNPVFQLFIFFCVFFHAINGLRITILDLFPKLILYHRQAITIEWAAFLAIYGFAIFTVIRTAVGG
ncbi:MAG: succinate dehydrogenase/fumarate reductase transmembrane subunit [Anaerolineales bacterium]